jgi:hypothetical protein
MGYTGDGCDPLKLTGVGGEDVRQECGDIERQEGEENDE